MLIKWRYKLEDNKNFNWERSASLILFSKIHKLYCTSYYKFGNTSTFAHFLERAMQPSAIKIRHVEPDQKTIRLLKWKYIDMNQANYIQMGKRGKWKMLSEMMEMLTQVLYLRHYVLKIASVIQLTKIRTLVT